MCDRTCMLVNLTAQIMPPQALHRVEYDDGDEEDEDLLRGEFRFPAPPRAALNPNSQRLVRDRPDPPFACSSAPVRPDACVYSMSFLAPDATAAPSINAAPSNSGRKFAA